MNSRKQTAEPPTTSSFFKGIVIASGIALSLVGAAEANDLPKDYVTDNGIVVGSDLKDKKDRELCSDGSIREDLRYCPAGSISTPSTRAPKPGWH